MISLVYFSSRFGNTHRFVEKLGYPALRLPLEDDIAVTEVDDTYV